jgi:hypothetical protein
MIHQQTQPKPFHRSFNTASIITAAALLLIGFVGYVWFEILTHSMLYPLMATGAFMGFFALPALLLLWRAPLQLKLALISTFLLLILVVRNLEWNSRKPFLRALDQVQTGMTVQQMDAAMQGFERGPQAGISDYGTVSFRHTDEGWGNSDIGLVTFRDGQVIRVEYLPD